MRKPKPELAPVTSTVFCFSANADGESTNRISSASVENFFMGMTVFDCGGFRVEHQTLFCKYIIAVNAKGRKYCYLRPQMLYLLKGLHWHAAEN
jgi:hypothetical protein